MKAEDENQMVVKDDQGNEHLIEMLFTYENEERGVTYVFFFDVNDPDNVMVGHLIEEGENTRIDMVEDEEELDEAEEVLNAWQDDPKIQELKKAE